MTARYHVPVGFGQCRFKFSVVGRPNIMGVTLGIEAEPDDGEIDALFLNESFKNDILDDGAGMGTFWTYLGVDYTLTQSFGDPELHTVPETVTGSLTPSSSPPNCSMLITKRTTNGGRKMRGRLFMPPAMLNDVDVDQAGNIAGAVVTAHQTLWNTFLQTLNDGLRFPTLFHQFDPDLGEVGETPTRITQFVVQPRIATQRRRLR